MSYSGRAEVRQNAPLDRLIAPDITNPEAPLHYDPVIIAKTADALINSLRLKGGDKLLIFGHTQAEELASAATIRAEAVSASVVPLLYTPTQEAAFIASASQKKLNRFVADQTTALKGITHTLNVRAGRTPTAYSVVDPEKMGKFTLSRGDFFRAITESRWTRIDLPVPEEGYLTGIAWQEYYSMIMQAFNRPWEKVREAQSTLVKLLQGDRLDIFIRPDNPLFTTQLTMSVKGMIPANSVIDRNFPGSEVFYAPVRGTLEGKMGIAYPSKFGDYILPNLILYWKKGEVVGYVVDGNTYDPRVEATLLAHKSKDFNQPKVEAGEVALGTNPALYKPVGNPLCAEKALGIHVAIGNAYKETDYEGQIVRLDNGVEANSHTDVVVPTRGTHSTIAVDGNVIQANGHFLHPDLAVLNSTYSSY